MSNFQAVDEDSREDLSERKQISIWLYRFAWFIEICAVLIGLAIALMQGLASFSSMIGDSGAQLGIAVTSNIFIAMMPFIMVALVELTKIPFVGAFYKTPSIVWKMVFGFSLLFISFITFESALNGFERNFSALTYSIDSLKKEVVTLDEELGTLYARRDDLQSLTSEQIESEYASRYEAISSERAEQAGVVQDRISGLRGSQDSGYAENLQQQITDARTQLTVIRAERQNEVDRTQQNASANSANLSEEVSNQRRSLQGQLGIEQSRLDTTTRAVAQEIDDAFFMNRSSVREQGEARIAAQQARVEELREELNNVSQLSAQTDLNSQLNQQIAEVNGVYQTRIDDLNTSIRDLSVELSKVLSQQESDIAVTLNSYSEELAGIQERFGIQLAEVAVLRERDVARLDNNSQLIEEIEASIFEKDQQRVAFRTRINQEVGDNQVYRMAQWWFGVESAADLERDQVIRIALIWFGSLAALVAFTGVMLALASYVVGDEKQIPTADRSEEKRRKEKLLRSLRRLLIWRRKLQRRSIIKTEVREVVKEVPVDRVVTVEKPVEIVKKEIIHVPVYTNDKRLLDMRFAENESET